MQFLLILRSSPIGKTSLYSAEPLLLGWFWAFFSFAGQFLLRIPPGNSRVWSHYAQWSFTLLTDFPRCALWNTIEVEVYHGHSITTTCQCCPRKNSVETSCCQEFLQILLWNRNKICLDWLEIISVFIHTHTEIPSFSTYTSRVLRLFWKTVLMFSHHPGPLLWQLCPPSITGVRPFLQLPPFSNTMKGALGLALDKVWGEFFLTWQVKPTKCNWAATNTNSTTKFWTSWKPIL